MGGHYLFELKIQQGKKGQNENSEVSDWLRCFVYIFLTNRMQFTFFPFYPAGFFLLNSYDQQIIAVISQLSKGVL